MLEFTVEDLSAEEIERLRAIYEPLAVSVRELVDATIRTEVDADTVAAVKADIDAATARLRSNQIDGAFGGVKRTTSGQSMSWGGNAVIGLRNPVAPPLSIHRDPDGRYWCDFDLGAAYEGPPGHVHGGGVGAGSGSRAGGRRPARTASPASPAASPCGIRGPARSGGRCMPKLRSLGSTA